MSPSEHPLVARRREITGSHPAYKPSAGPSGSACGCASKGSACAHARGSAGIADIRTETQARAYTPTAAELSVMGLSLAEWNALGDTDRVEYARGAGASSDGGNVLYDTPEKRAVAAASASGDEAAFTAALERVPVDQRAALVEQHLRAQGASDEAVRAGLFRLAQQGLRGLTDWLNSDLQRDLAQIRERSATEQTRITEEQRTARAEIDAATERYRIDHAGGAANPAPPAAPGNGTNFLLALGLALGLAGVFAMTSQRKG